MKSGYIVWCNTIRIRKYAKFLNLGYDMTKIREHNFYTKTYMHVKYLNKKH